METRQIRVLHLVKPSQTYILSRSPVPMAIYPITGASADIASRFATVSLKTCIELICDSSSEIFSDSQKDYSVYSLDPLESYGPSSSSSPPGQSVACGRLSAIRSSHNRAMVTGTLMKDKMGQDALELVFVLHETLAVSQVLDPAAAHRISAALARSTSEQQKQQNRAQRLEQRQQKVKQKDEEEPRPDRKRLVPVLLATEAERLLVQSGQSGRAYRRSIRPLSTENNGEGEVDSKVDPGVEQSVQPSVGKYNRTVTDSLTEQSGQLKVVNGDPEPKPKPFAFRPYPTLGVTQKPASSALPELSSHLSSTPPISQHTLNLLAILDVAKGDPRVNRDALFNIMSYIDSAAKKDSTATITDILRRLVPTTTTPATSPQRPQTPPQTPVASNTPASPDDGIVLLDKENVNPTAFRRRAEHDTEDAKLLAASMGPSNSTPLVRLGAGLTQSVRSNTSSNNDPTPPIPSTPPTARKRTLSEMSDDGRCFGQGRVVQLDRSSPPRFHRTNQNMSPGFSKDQPIIIPDSPAAPRLGVRSRVKPYVVPDWARTETVMQPRLSEQAQEAIKEAERRKLEEKSAKRVKKVRDRTSSQMHRTISTPAVFSTSADKPIASNFTLPSGSMAPPPPVTATSLLPIIAAANSSIPLPRSRLLSPSRSLSPTPTQHFVPPCTPPRKRIVSATSSPEEEFSLFTPREMNTPRRGPSLFESPSIRSPGLRSIHQRDPTPPPSSEPVAENDSDDGRSDGEDDLLDRELNNALEEAGGSSPPAISPMDDADTQPQAQVEDNDDEEEPSKQFWSGLPPSSPPAPSSPMLFPVVDELPNDHSDDFELPMTSSDFEVIDYNENPASDGLENRNRDGLSQDNEAVPSDEVQFDDDALAAILELITNNNPNADSTSSLNPDTDTNDDSGDILKDLGAISYFDDQHSTPSDQNTLLNFPSDISFDNPSFWNAMGPLLDQDSSSGSNGAEGSDQIKNLLSGCVL